MKRKTIIFLVLIGLGVGSLVLYRITTNDKNDSERAGNVAGGRIQTKVYGKVIKGKPFSDHLSLSGSIEPNEIVDIRPEISGIVEAISFSEGGRVSAGQVLIRINDVELRAELSQAVTRNSLAGENARRAKLLLEKEAISQEEYDIASADYRTAKAQIQVIEAQLAKTVIKAPFSGTIGLRNISKGSYITPTTSVAQLVNTDRVKVLFSIPEKYVQMVKNNSSIKLNIQGSREDHTAMIYAIEPIVESATRTLQVKAIADNSAQSLIPGTFANIVFPLETIERGLLVPAEALIPIQNGKKIFLLKNGKAFESLVETGARTKEDVLILSGIQEGDTVLTSGVMSLRDGSPVQVTLR
ncbi:efflux RND transporter periplasmic adaptor subunit [Sphingobacterium alkalisoli]|uniref:Efflux RND transporter periplasmic adaptor subunit n=1 Tax=Sphingobacterium alkalisoli TaxID=1874115 RepID=A0A4U0GU73_9SPHI|nr:efflux RND transporter periplasmic adaptor subunit [Sphingobacterium alkalisoli]TJY62533.1 efflux RND transporter periplasmic adaptor subunit [Sphingobacterium alkalisoli]GGH28891.1 MexH family multidrug efflux RND transporter periplasmic adaptor subunit [Sphingobacterium alkalisoli]